METGKLIRNAPHQKYITAAGEEVSVGLHDLQDRG
jgi:hypothetical protein